MFFLVKIVDNAELETILFNEGFSVDYAYTEEPRGYNFHIAPVISIGNNKYVVDTIETLGGKTGVVLYEDWVKKQNPKGAMILPGNSNGTFIPNPIIEAWYNASEKTESINDYAANQIEHYYKTGKIE